MRSEYIQGWTQRCVIMNRGTLRVGAVHFLASPPPVPCAPCDGICDYIVGDAQLPRVRAQQWTECSELGAQSMHADSGHDRLDGLRLNACIAWKSCQRKIWTGLSSTGPWPSATCTGHAGSSFLGHVNTYHRTSPCALRFIVVLRVHVKDIGSCRDS